MSTGPEFSDAVSPQPEAAGSGQPAGEVNEAGAAAEAAPAEEQVGPSGNAANSDAAGQQNPDAVPAATADAPPAGETAAEGTATRPDGEEAHPDGEEAPRPIEGAELQGAIEAILLVVDEPVTTTVLAQVVGVPQGVVVEVLQTLRQEYDDAGRGFELREIGPGWRLYTRADFAPYVERFVLDGQQARLTQAALETLAVVAYRQPVSRSRVSAVRGVNVDGVMRTLVSRGLVEEAGTEEESGAILYRTTPYFLERLGLRDLTELPSLANFLPESTTIDQLEGELSGEGRDV